MQCKIHNLNELKDYKFVVVLSRYRGKIMLSQHRFRDTWETQGGHIEKDELPLQAAKRELFEESGAVDFDIVPIFDYWAADETSWANGMVFFADVRQLSALPVSEMKTVQTFDRLPDNLTYPDITPKLFDHAREYFSM